MRTQIELDNAAAAELAGTGDRILQPLDEQLDCNVFLRGNLLTLDGEPEAVDAAAAVVRELSELVAQGHELAPGTIEAVSPRARSSTRTPRAILEDVIWRHRATKVAPKTVHQKRYVDSIRRNTITFGIGPAGTGKTFLAVALAAAALHRREVNRIILTRPAVEAGERLGFLPGDLMAKVDPYLRPLFDALHDMLEAEKVSAAPRARRDRGRAAGVHAWPHAERQLHHPRRGAEHDARADEDVPDAARASTRRSSSPATSPRSTCRASRPPACLPSARSSTVSRTSASCASARRTWSGTSSCAGSSPPTTSTRSAQAPELRPAKRA